MCSTIRAGKTLPRTSASRLWRNTERSWILGRSCSKRLAGRFSARVRAMNSRARSRLILRLKRCAGACSSSSFSTVWVRHSEPCCRPRKRAEHGGRAQLKRPKIGGAKKQKGPEFIGALSRNFLIPIRDAADYFFFLVAAFFFPFLAAFFID